MLSVVPYTQASRSPMYLAWVAGGGGDVSVGCTVVAGGVAATGELGVFSIDW